MSNRDNDTHNLESLQTLIDEEMEWDSMLKELAKASKARRARIKSGMQALELAEVATDSGHTAKLSERNQGSWDRELAMQLLDAHTFTQIFTTSRSKVLKVG